VFGGFEESDGFEGLVVLLWIDDCVVVTMCERVPFVRVLRAAVVVCCFVPLEEIPLPLVVAGLLFFYVDPLHDIADLGFPFVIILPFVLGGHESLLFVLLLYGHYLHCFLLTPSLLLSFLLITSGPTMGANCTCTG